MPVNPGLRGARQDPALQGLLRHAYGQAANQRPKIQGVVVVTRATSPPESQRVEVKGVPQRLALRRQPPNLLAPLSGDGERGAATHHQPISPEGEVEGIVMELGNKSRAALYFGAAFVVLLVYLVFSQKSAEIGLKIQEDMLNAAAKAQHVESLKLDNLERRKRIESMNSSEGMPTIGKEPTKSGLYQVNARPCTTGSQGERSAEGYENALSVNTFQMGPGCAWVSFQEASANMQWWGNTHFEHPESGRSCTSPKDCVGLIADVVKHAHDKRVRLVVQPGGFFMNWGAVRSSTSTI